MISTRTEAVQKALAPLLLVLLGTLVVLSALQRQHWDSDILWALKTGEWIVGNMRVPDSDPFSYTFGGRPWVDFTWGFQVLAYLSYSLLGQWTGLFILQTALVSLTFTFVYLTLRLLTGNRAWAALPILLMAFAASHTRLFIRPHLFEFFFVSLFFLLLTLHEKRGRAAYLIALLPLQVVWINVHSSAVLGILITGAYAAGEVIEGFGRGGLKGIMRHGAALRLSLAAMLLPAASLINPYGARLLLFPFVHNSVDNSDAIRHISEWTRPALRELFFYVFPFPLDHFAFVLLAVGILALFVVNFRSLRARSFILYAGAMYMAVSHVRWVPLFAFFAAPVMASCLEGSLARLDGRPRLKAAFFALGVFFALVLAVDYMRPGGVFAANRGLGLKPGKFPVGTVEFMKRESVRGNIYNDYVYGGYIIHALPEVKVFIDGRTPTVYSPYFFWTSRLVEDRGRWKRLEEEHAIDIALIKHESPLCQKLRTNAQWALVSFDDASVLFLKRNEKFSGTVAAYAMSDLNPCSTGDKLDIPDDAASLGRVRGEAERAISYGPGSGRQHRILGLALTKLGRYEDAASELRKAAAFKKDAYTWYDLGVALSRLGRRDEARQAFESALGLDSRFKEARLALGLAWHDSGDHAEAASHLERYLEIADDAAEAIAYRSIGMSYFSLADYRRAEAYLKRAAFLTDEPKELAGLCYYLGNTLFALGESAQGLLWYSRSVKAYPDYAKVLRELALGHRAAGREDAAEAILSLEELRL